jgi:hypothetical protein
MLGLITNYKIGVQTLQKYHYKSDTGVNRMFKFKNLMSILFSFILFISPLAPVHAGLWNVSGLGIFSTKKLAEKGITGIRNVRTASGEMAYEFVSETGEVISTYILGISSPKVLNEFKPSLLRQYLHTLRNNAGSITLHKLKQFPLEAFAFFTAIGAITSSQLIFKFHENPVAMDQFLTSQKDPIGQLGFAAFMITNGLVAEPLMSLVQSRTAQSKSDSR